MRSTSSSLLLKIISLLRKKNMTAHAPLKGKLCEKDINNFSFCVSSSLLKGFTLSLQLDNNNRKNGH